MEPFYGQKIDPVHQQQVIKKILLKYRKEPPTEELKRKIYNELVEAKAQGKITIPFKVVMRKHSRDKQRDYIEVILDTKV